MNLFGILLASLSFAGRGRGGRWDAVTVSMSVVFVVAAVLADRRRRRR